MKKKRLIQIAVPALIVLIIAGLWFLKNADTLKNNPSAVPAATEGETQAAEDPNFALDAESIDLASLTAYGLPVIIDFGSDSCIPCQKMAPVLVKMNAVMRGKAIIKFVDVWKYTTAANDFPVQVIPTQVLINRDGTPYVPGDSMSDSGIQFTLYSDKATGAHVFTVHQGGLTETEMRRILADMGVSE